MTAKKAPKKAKEKNDSVRTGLGVESLKQAFVNNLFYLQGRFPVVATPNDNYMALAYTVRDRLLERWIQTSLTYLVKRARTVCYLSAEFLLGPHLRNNLINLGVYEQVKEAMHELGHDLNELLDQEEEPGLGNGGLGRLAACYLDSLATLQIPAIGYGIRYEFGIFDQEITDGWQVEVTDKWLRLGNPWEIARPEVTFSVRLGGHTESYHDEKGRLPGPMGARSAHQGNCLRHSHRRVPGFHRQSPPVCGKPKPASPSTSRPSTWGITTEPSIKKSPPRTSAKFFIRMTSRSRESSCGSSSSTSSSPAPFRTCSVSTSNPRTTWSASTRSTPCSSTTPTPPSRCPS